MIQLHVAHFLLGSIAFLQSASGLAFSKFPLPTQVELIYPKDGSVPLDEEITFGWSFENPSEPPWGAYYITELNLMLPSGNMSYVGSMTNYETTWREGEPMYCPAVNKDPPRLSYIPISRARGEIGTYTAIWNFTYTFPTSVNISTESVQCIGFGSTESFVLQRQFSVIGSTNISTFAPLTYPTKSELAALGPSPTGSLYSVSSGGGARNHTPLHSQKLALLMMCLGAWLYLSGLIYG
ncbi:hypothetical protein DL93DRAFT_2227328 [Clavulina sp. PMI_390]|nr:hypothetical protein DL93DRAFT_2227328 [Clavulina sp. PMI_390]